MSAYDAGETTFPPSSARCHFAKSPTVEHNAPAENGCERSMNCARVVLFGPLLYPSANAGLVVFDGQYDVDRRPSGFKNCASRYFAYFCPDAFSITMPSSTYPVLLYRYAVPGAKSNVSAATNLTIASGDSASFHVFCHPGDDV